jgi:hypothetical protein
MSKRRTVSLEIQLNSYSAASQASAPRKESQDRSGRWPVFAAAAGSALALTTSATADIFYSGIQNITVTALVTTFNDALATHPLKIGGKQFGLTVRHSSNGFIKYPEFNYAGNAFAGGYLAAGPGVGILRGSSLGWRRTTNNLLQGLGGARRLSKGAPISAGAGAFKGTSGTGKAPLNVAEIYDGGTSIKGQFAIGQPGFAGIRLATGGGNFDYGWIQLEVDGTNFRPGGCCDPVADSVTAIDWAYNEIPGAPIDAGQETSATPEPGGRSLALLAAGCIGVLAWRRHRAQRAAKVG